MALGVKHSIEVRKIAQRFFQDLCAIDCHDCPEVFNILDTVVREEGFMISCEQRGIFGTILKFERIEP